MVVGVPGSWRALGYDVRYTPSQVERLLPAVWGIEIPAPPMEHQDVCRVHGRRDRCFTVSLRRPTPGPDCDDMAEAADVQQAWRYAYLRPEVRHAVELYCRYGATQEEIARATGVSVKTVSVRINLGLSQLATWLNGGRA